MHKSAKVVREAAEQVAEHESENGTQEAARW